jgi:hypothetical protein
MSLGLEIDKKGNPVQGFAPDKIRTVATGEYIDPIRDKCVAFRVGEVVDMRMLDVGPSVPLVAGSITVCKPGKKYWFGTEITLEIMD